LRENSPQNWLGAEVIDSYLLVQVLAIVIRPQVLSSPLAIHAGCSPTHQTFEGGVSTIQSSHDR